MVANREYELVLRRGGRRDPVDVVEIVHIASGETIFLWDLHPGETRRVVKALRADLAQLDAEDFADRWMDWRAAPSSST